MLKFMSAVKMEEAGEEGAAGGSGGDVTIESLQAQLAAKEAEIKAIAAKKDELLTETKQAKEAKKKAEEAAAKKAVEDAKKAGDYEALYKSSEAERERVLKDLEGLRGNIANEKRDTAALKMATELADGANAELLSTFIAQRLQWSEDGLKVTDKSGQLTVSGLDDLKREFANDARFSALLKGNQSSGGGATGGTNGGGAAKFKTRAEFNALNHTDRAKFFSSGGKVTD